VPIPDEFLLVFSGFQIGIGNMGLPETLIIATLGSFTGMNLSYLIGRQLDIHLVKKIRFMNIDKRLVKAEAWFARFGDKLIVIGYFFPGLRHFAAYFAGMSKFYYPKYMGLVSIGSIIWTSAFILLGRLLGHHAYKIMPLIYHYLWVGAVIIGMLIFIIYLITTHMNGDNSSDNNNASNNNKNNNNNNNNL
jgi:membrane protein DedA with SNARE-associated domain